MRVKKARDRARWNLTIDKELYKEIKRLAVEKEKRNNEMLEEIVRLGIEVLKEREKLTV